MDLRDHLHVSPETVVLHHRRELLRVELGILRARLVDHPGTLLVLARVPCDSQQRAPPSNLFAEVGYLSEAILIEMANAGSLKMWGLSVNGRIHYAELDKTVLPPKFEETLQDFELPPELSPTLQGSINFSKEVMHNV
jgi:hypothetical protein